MMKMQRMEFMHKMAHKMEDMNEVQKAKFMKKMQKKMGRKGMQMFKNLSMMHKLLHATEMSNKDKKRIAERIMKKQRRGRRPDRSWGSIFDKN